MVTERIKRPRDKRQAHYTTSPGILSYMVSRLRPAPEDIIWEPCAGAGDLISALVRKYPQLSIRASEIEPTAVAALEKLFLSNTNVEIKREDVLDVGTELFDDHHAKYDRVIANPPYGGWQEYDRRKELKERFPKLYVKETYSVFLYRAVQSLKRNGRLVFIIPDTFLWLHRHEYLRRYLFSNTRIEELALFPSRFFPGIHFGYSGLCIITLVNQRPDADCNVRVIHSIKDPSILMFLSNRDEQSGTFDEAIYSQEKILSNNQCALQISSKARHRHGSDSAGIKLGDVAAVVTGFYSGNDRHWLRVSSDAVRGAKNYLRVEPKKIAVMSGEMSAPLNGIAGERCFIPIVKGGASHFIKPSAWYVDWSREAVSAYKRKGRNPARFQNANFYFRQGIAVPMVASSTLTAALLNHRLFDQGIVGVFPNDERLLKYILAFLNTRLATELLREINPTANNSANYLKRLPLPLPKEEDLHEIDVLVDTVIDERASQRHPMENVRARIETVICRIWNHGQSEEPTLTLNIPAGESSHKAMATGETGTDETFSASR